MSYEELELKVAKLQSANQTLLKERRLAKKRISELQSSRDGHRLKYKAIKSEGKRQKRKLRSLGAFGESKIERHKYDTVTVDLCVSIYMLGGCSLRGVVRILRYQNIFLGLGMEQIPSKSSIENWVQKCGHYVYEYPDTSRYEGGYGLIVDECMVVGQERMLCILAVKADKQEEKALSLCHAEVVLLETKASWSGEEIASSVQKVAEKLGTKASYIISDAGSNLTKGLRDNGDLRICDCGHEVARLTEQAYKNDGRLSALCTTAGQTKFREVMKETGYLVPPKQRSIARFMNLSCLLGWARTIISNIGRFSAEEQLAYSCIGEHKDIIEELSAVFGLSHQILGILKTEGLSYATVEACKGLCSAFRQQAAAIPLGWVDKILQYLEQEKAKLPDKETTWHVSSDIIESLFGRFKARKADNALYGVTPFVLALPLMTKVDMVNAAVNIDFQAALEGTLMSDLDAWNKKNLIENQVVRRRKMLKK